MININKINEETLYSEFNTLIEIGDLIEKNLMMEQFFIESKVDTGADVNIKVDDSTNTQLSTQSKGNLTPPPTKNNTLLKFENEHIEPGDVIDNVNGWTRFWNWVKRCFYVIGAAITGAWSQSRLKSFLKKMSESYRDSDVISFPAITYETFKRINTNFNKAKISYMGPFDQNVNYQKMCVSMKNIISKDDKTNMANELGPLGNHKGKQIKLKISDIKKTLEEFKQSLEKIKKEASGVHKLISEQSKAFDKNMTKSNNFRQYVQYLTYATKGDIHVLVMFGKFFNALSTILGNDGQAKFISYVNTTGELPLKNTETLALPGPTEDSVLQEMKEYIDAERNRKSEMVGTWLNKSDPGYIRWASHYLEKDIMYKYPLEKYEYIIVFIMPGNNAKAEPISRTFIIPHNENSTNYLKSIIKNGRKQKIEDVYGYIFDITSDK